MKRYKCAILVFVTYQIIQEGFDEKLILVHSQKKGPKQSLRGNLGYKS